METSKLDSLISHSLIASASFICFCFEGQIGAPEWKFHEVPSSLLDHPKSQHFKQPKTHPINRLFGPLLVGGGWGNQTCSRSPRQRTKHGWDISSSQSAVRQRRQRQTRNSCVRIFESSEPIISRSTFDTTT